MYIHKQTNTEYIDVKQYIDNKQNITSELLSSKIQIYIFRIHDYGIWINVKYIHKTQLYIYISGKGRVLWTMIIVKEYENILSANIDLRYKKLIHLLNNNENSFQE